MDLLVVFGHSHFRFLSYVDVRNFARIPFKHLRRAFGEIRLDKIVVSVKVLHLIEVYGIPW